MDRVSGPESNRWPAARPGDRPTPTRHKCTAQPGESHQTQCPRGAGKVERGEGGCRRRDKDMIVSASTGRTRSRKGGGGGNRGEGENGKEHTEKGCCNLPLACDRACWRIPGRGLRRQTGRCRRQSRRRPATARGDSTPHRSEGQGKIREKGEGGQSDVISQQTSAPKSNESTALGRQAGRALTVAAKQRTWIALQPMARSLVRRSRQ